MPARTSFLLGSSTLSPALAWRIATQLAGTGAGVRLELSPDARNRIQHAAGLVSAWSDTATPTYGVNTGVGALRHLVIEKAHLPQLQVNLLRSHACGVGDPLPRPVVAGMWLHLLNSTAQGHRGIRPQTVDVILRLLNAGVLAQVPSRGSVGASGDLAPAAHAALVLIGEGSCTVPIDGTMEVLPAAKALQRLGILPVELAPKEGLSLMNGTHLTTALACQVWSEARSLWETANLALALSVYGFRSTPCIDDDRVLALHHPATLYAGSQIRLWMEGGSLRFRNHLQDPYSFRCAPQVHGAVWKEIEQSEEWVTEELSATTDNPVLFEHDLGHGGNFHAIYPARVLDRLASAMTQLASIAERRISLGMNSAKTGLSDFLTPEAGLNSGLMMAQTTAAALVSECKSLSFPASVDTIPTNCDQEDHVSMGPIAGLKAIQIARNLRDVLAIEILAACQAIHLRGAAILPPNLRRAYDLFRTYVAPVEHDRIFSEDIRTASRLIEQELLSSSLAARHDHAALAKIS